MLDKNGLILPFVSKENHMLSVVRDGQQIDIEVPWWIQTPDQVAKREQILQNSFFLLRQGELGEVLRCTRCNTKHQYFTLMCVERPFDGLKEGLYAYWYHAGRYGTENFLSKVSLQRYEAITKVLSKDYPDIAAAHPQTARTLKTEDEDFDIGTVALGILEPISKQKAEALAWNINLKGIKPPFVLKGLQKDATS